MNYLKLLELLETFRIRIYLFNVTLLLTLILSNRKHKDLSPLKVIQSFGMGSLIWFKCTYWNHMRSYNLQ